jgi:hypothetical protein
MTTAAGEAAIGWGLRAAVIAAADGRHLRFRTARAVAVYMVVGTIATERARAFD